jgi:hypothetical protein
VAGFFECGNEPSSYINCGEFLELAGELLASQEGLCCMGLVSQLVVQLMS